MGWSQPSRDEFPGEPDGAAVKGESRDDKAEYLDCAEALHRVYHFLDGELTKERRAEIDRHLKACLPCVEVFGFEQEIRRLVASCCGREQVPDELRQRIARAIHHEHESGPHSDEGRAAERA